MGPGRSRDSQKGCLQTSDTQGWEGTLRTGWPSDSGPEMTPASREAGGRGKHGCDLSCRQPHQESDSATS